MSENNIKIDKKKIESFFKERANKHDENQPLKTVIYQDKNPNLAKERDKYEKYKIKKIINFSNNDTVLDIGCGIGRWADEISNSVKRYVGIDFINEFIDIANSKYKKKNNIQFFCLQGSELSEGRIINHSPYSIFMILGLFPYISDDDGYGIIKQLNKISSDNSKIIIREPIAIEKEMILNNVWSEDMETNYSAKYRTHDWFIKMFNDFLLSKGYKIVVDEPLFPNHLNNRKETKQHLFCLKKTSK